MKLISLKRKSNLKVINEEVTDDIYSEIGHNIDSYIDKDIHSRLNKKYQLVDFFNIIDDIISNDTVKQMKN